MSFLRNARRKLSLSRTSEDKLDEDSAPTTPPADDSTASSGRRRFSLKPGGGIKVIQERKTSESSNINIDMLTAQQQLEDDSEKIKPSSYLYLLNENPKLTWKSADGGTDEDELLDVGFNPLLATNEEDHVMHNKQRNITANCKKVNKFSEDHFDDYLYEIGILTERYHKFEDYMSEIEILRQCDSSNFLKFYDVYFHENKLWIFTEYCPSGSLEELIDDLNKPFGIETIHYAIKDVLYGLDYLHTKCQITHLDLKCANLLIGSEMAIKITNFELAVRNSLKQSVKNDKRYFYIKSPHYAAPEVLKCQGYAANSFRSDIWSLAVTAIEMAEMLPPNSEINPEAIIEEYKSGGESLLPRMKDGDAWPDEFREFLDDCLKIQYEQRPTAAELLKHAFIRKIRSSRADLEKCLSERKTIVHAQLKERFEAVHGNIEKMQQMKQQPDRFINEYFADLHEQIEVKARDAKYRVDLERDKLLDQLKSYQTACKEDAHKVGSRHAEAIEKINKKFQREFELLREGFSKDMVSENAIHRTKAHVKTLNIVTDGKLKEMQSRVFNEKTYTFQPKINPIKIGDLIVESKNAPSTASNAASRRKQSVVSITSEPDEEYESTNKSLRPSNRLIRLEIRRESAKKRYSIY